MLPRVWRRLTSTFAQVEGRARPGGGKRSERPLSSFFPWETTTQRAHRDLVVLAATHLLETGHWPDLQELEDKLKSIGKHQPLAIVANTLPPNLGAVDEHQVIRLTVRGLSEADDAGPVLELFLKSVHLAGERHLRRKTSIRLPHLRREVASTRQKARLLTQIIDAEGNVFSEPNRRLWLRRFDPRWQKEIGAEVHSYARARSIQDYLAIQAAHPVIAAAGTGHSTDADPEAPKPNWSDTTIGKVFTLTAANVLTAVILIVLALSPTSVAPDFVGRSPGPWRPPSIAPAHCPAKTTRGGHRTGVSHRHAAGTPVGSSACR